MNTTGYCDETGKQIKFDYATERRDAGWFCDRCGDRLSANKKPRRCRFCGCTRTYYVSHRTHGSAS